MVTSLFHTLSVRAESLTHNEAVRSILADIPMFAVGMFTLGAFTLLLFLRRVNWVLGCLHGAIFVAFIAALLDLVELICRGQHQADDPSVNQNPLLGLTIAREIGYALSFGLRFVFFWGYAGCAPPKTKPARMHSGRWERWGLLGHILRWSILVAIVAITSLQVVYRLYTPLKQIDTIHQIGGVVEASVSAVIILKLLLNVYLANLDSAGTTSRMRVLLWYSPMVIALGLSLGIGAATVIQSLFSESILGRLLQGIELYIASLFILVVTCDPLNEEAMKQPPSRLNRTSSFQGLSPMGVRLSGFQMGPPRISLTPIPTLQMPSGDAKLREGYSNSRRPSYATRLSTWVSSRRISFRSDLPHSPGLDRLWDQDRAERGSSPVGETKGSRMSHETFPAEPKQSPAYPDPVYTSILRESQTDDKLDIADPVLPLASPVASQELLQAPRALTPSSTDSPIHTLHGVVQPLQRRPTKASTAASEAKTDIDDPRRFFDDSARSSGISGLLRQQEELDKSIAALKLFSAENNRDTRSSVDMPTPKAASEFSLSNFPEPPWGRASVATVDSAATVRQGPTPPAIVETEEPVVVEDSERDREQSLPVTEDGIREILRTTRGIRSESGGTQYEITSFIGGLTRPGHAAQASMSSMSSARRAPAPVQPMPTGSSSLPSPERPQRPKVSLDIPASITESPSADSPLTQVSPITPLSQPRVIGLPARPKPKTGSVTSSLTASSPRSQRTDNFTPTPF